MSYDYALQMKGGGGDNNTSVNIVRFSILSSLVFAMYHIPHSLSIHGGWGVSFRFY